MTVIARSEATKQSRKVQYLTVSSIFYRSHNKIIYGIQKVNSELKNIKKHIRRQFSGDNRQIFEGLSI